MDPSESLGIVIVLRRRPHPRGVRVLRGPQRDFDRSRVKGGFEAMWRNAFSRTRTTTATGTK